MVTHILEKLSSLPVLLLASAAPANGALNAMQQYPIMAVALSLSLPDSGLAE